MTDETEIFNAMRADFLEALNSGDVDGYLEYLSDDAVVMPPNEPALVGRGAILSWLQAFFGQFSVQEEWSSREVMIAGAFAYDWGRYTAIVTPLEGGERTLSSGKYLWVIRRQPDGGWQYTRLIWNHDSEPAEI